MRRRMIGIAVAGTFALGLVAGPQTPALAKGGEVGGVGNEYFLTNNFTSTAHRFVYGRAGDELYVGDWDGDGRDTLAIRRGNTFHVTNSLTGGPAEQVFKYGRRGDVVLVGDWDGDGKDSLAVRRGSEYHVKNTVTGGNADYAFHYGRANDIVLVGDWDRNGKDTFAVRRGSTYHMRNTLSGGNADTVVTYGRSGDTVLVGDWDGDGRDSLTVRRGNEYHIANAIRGGAADRVERHGRASDAVFVGDWDRDGKDTIGLRRSKPARTPISPPPATTPRPANVRPASPDLDCKEFRNWDEAQATYEYSKRRGLGDVHRLDADDDGTACESLR